MIVVTLNRFATCRSGCVLEKPLVRINYKYHFLDWPVNDIVVTPDLPKNAVWLNTSPGIKISILTPSRYLAEVLT